jgi:hypothetical protein
MTVGQSREGLVRDGLEPASLGGENGMRTKLRSVLLSLGVAAIAVGLLCGAAFAQPCAGDCDDSGDVSLGEVVTSVNVGLGQPMSECANLDMNADDHADINELVSAVSNSIHGCNCDPGRKPFTSTFEAIQAQIFERRGCTQAICHGAAPFQGGLDLRPESAYRSLYEVPSTEVDMNRVTPGARDRSYLFQKLAAATDPTQMVPEFQIAQSPMPIGEPLTLDELRAIQLWIYNGAPENDVVPGTEDLLGACLPTAKPITIDPLPAPAADEGIQFVMPPWPLPKHSEFEGCFATYYDFTQQVPEEFKNGDLFTWKGFEVRQDPQSHHLLMYYSPLNLAPGGVDRILNDPNIGPWTCYGGTKAGETCDPTDQSFCGEGSVCASKLVPSFACVGYGPGGGAPAEIVGGAPQAQTNFVFSNGVYQQLPMRGVMYWNAHAFNLTNLDHTMNGRVNYYFADEQRYQACRISNFNAIFRPNNPPFTKQKFCNKHKFPVGARVFQLFAHTHKHGEYYWVTNSKGEVIYENLDFADPVIRNYDPPLEFDSPVDAERTVEYCAIFNNGCPRTFEELGVPCLAPGQPDTELVTRASRVPTSAEQSIGRCKPVACVEPVEKIGAACEDNADCDSSEGAGDGLCDACPITGGESTQNEMFVLFGAHYVDDSVPNADLSCLPYPEELEPNQ